MKLTETYLGMSGIHSSWNWERKLEASCIPWLECTKLRIFLARTRNLIRQFWRNAIESTAASESRSLGSPAHHVHFLSFIIDSWLIYADFRQDGGVGGEIYALIMSACGSKSWECCDFDVDASIDRPVRGTHIWHWHHRILVLTRNFFTDKCSY